MVMNPKDWERPYWGHNRDPYVVASGLEVHFPTLESEGVSVLSSCIVLCCGAQQPPGASGAHPIHLPGCPHENQ